MMLFKMSPTVPRNDAANSRWLHPILRCKGINGASLRFTNIPYIRIGQFRQAVSFTTRIAPLCHRIQRIVHLCPNKQVGWVHTTAVVAFMTNQHPCRDGAVMQLPRVPRWSDVVMFPIPSSRGRPCPYPASPQFRTVLRNDAVLIDTLPEPFTGRPNRLPCTETNPGSFDRRTGNRATKAFVVNPTLKRFSTNDARTKGEITPSSSDIMDGRLVVHHGLLPPGASLPVVISNAGAVLFYYIVSDT